MPSLTSREKTMWHVKSVRLMKWLFQGSELEIISIHSPHVRYNYFHNFPEKICRKMLIFSQNLSFSPDFCPIFCAICEKYCASGEIHRLYISFHRLHRAGGKMALSLQRQKTKNSSFDDNKTIHLIIIKKN